jgi:hypothetical protein
MTEETQTLLREEVQKVVNEALAVRKASVGVEETAAYVGICLDTLYEEWYLGAVGINDWMTEQEWLNSRRV